MIILDPGFEIPALTAGTQWDAPTAGPPVFPPGSPWEFHVGGGSASGIASNGAPIVGTAGAAPEGTQVLYLDNGATVLQDFTLSAPLAGPVSFVASLNGPTGPLTVGQVYIDVWSGATHMYHEFATISNTVGYQRYTLPELDLPPGAYEIAVTFVGDTDSMVLMDAIMFTLPASWLRLVHESGTSWVQQDGTRVQVRANNADVLDLPLPTLSGTPATLVGKDPATGLPAFCPPPPPSPAQLLISPVPPTALPDCAQARCGVAVAMEQHLESLYDQWAQWLGPLAAVGGALITAGLLSLTLDPFFDLAALASAKVIWQLIRSTVIALTGDEINNMLGNLTPDMTREIQRLLYCQLTCADNVVTPTIAQIQAWEHGVYSDLTLGLNVLQNALLVALLQFTPLQDWQVVALNAQPSSACTGWTCP